MPQWEGGKHRAGVYLGRCARTGSLKRIQVLSTAERSTGPSHRAGEMHPAWYGMGLSAASAAFLVFFPTAAGTRVVAPGLRSGPSRILGAHGFHQLFDRLAGVPDIDHSFEIGPAVDEKLLVAGA